MAFESAVLNPPSPQEALGIPTEIRDAYEVAVDATESAVTCGHVNQTFLVTQGVNHSIMQRLSGALDPETLRDAAVVAEHLAAKGWESPGLLPTATGELGATDHDGHTWRHQQYIASDGTPPGHTRDLMLLQGAAMLGRWHRDISDLSYRPQFGIPHFHDTAYYAHRLETTTDKLPDEKTRYLATQAMRGFEELPVQEATTQQVIHGDPKLDNMLFRNGVPFTLIDFDTLMEDSPWVDVGDLLRSVIGKRLTAGDRIDTDLLEQFSTTYHNNAHLAESADLSYRHAMQATARIATELAMRYLLDIYEEDYFSWDNKSFESRRDNHIPRIELQLNVAKLAVELAGK